jgi:translation initiation factor IF-2
VGTVLESDVMLATATANTAETGVIILAFRVRVDSIAKEKAESEGIEIKRFAIIYELLDYIDGVMKGMYKPEIIEKVIGSAEIREIFKIKDTGKIAGCMVREGFIRKAEKVRLFREGKQIWEGKIKDLKRFKDDVMEVQEGFEFGVSFVNYENFKKGDIIECFTEEEKKLPKGKG